MRSFTIIISTFVLFLSNGVLIASAQAMPYATTVVVENADASGGEVVIYDEATDTYEISESAQDKRAFGITSLRPILVLTTASGTIPVVTVGTVLVKVSNENGPIQRGDLLTTASTPGTAMRADVTEANVFAVALEANTNSDFILVEMGVDQAQALQQTRFQNQQMASSTLQEQSKKISLIRGSIAAVIVVGGLLFVLYSFRSTIAKGVVSIGRNPRAKTSILALTFGNIFFALILCAVVVFIAIGILILPV